MKVMLGYFNSADGKYIGPSKPADNGNFYLIMGTLRKKICESPEATPYRRHEVRTHCKTYCDKTRLDVTIHEYKNFNKHRTITRYSMWHYDYGDGEGRKRAELEQAKISKILQFIIDNVFPELFRKFGITNHRFVYFPGWFELDWKDLPG